MSLLIAVFSTVFSNDKSRWLDILFRYAAKQITKRFYPAELLEISFVCTYDDKIVLSYQIPWQTQYIITPNI